VPVLRKEGLTGEVHVKKVLALLFCALFLSIAASSANAAGGIRLWPHHKDSSKSSEAPKQKPKKSLLHRSKPSRDEVAHSEATNGMVGPKSVGWRHPEPGPAGYGAK